jgi:hypothetical protein
MSKQRRDAIDAALRAVRPEPEHGRAPEKFEAFALRPYPAGVAAADATVR